jgi:hypothetical protein
MVDKDKSSVEQQAPEANEMGKIEIDLDKKRTYERVNIPKDEADMLWAAYRATLHAVAMKFHSKEIKVAPAMEDYWFNKYDNLVRKPKLLSKLKLFEARHKERDE